MGRLVEGLWDCRYCESKGIKGSVRECPNCGRPRDDNTKFYLPSNISYVPEDKAKNLNRNPDWLCVYCNSLNSDSDNVCKSCGSNRNSENPDYFSMKRKPHQSMEKSVKSDIFSSANTFEDSSDFARDNNTLNSIVISTSNFFKKSWKYFLITILSISLLTGLIYLLIPKNEEITITSFSWERSISIEKFQTVEENGWVLPSEARLQYTRQEIYTYEQIFDHYETRSRQVEKQRISHYEDYVSGYRDLGNGYFEEIIAQRPVYETYYETEYYQEPVYRSEPVYKTKYYYEIDKWLFDRSLNTSGSDQNPYWHEIPDLPKTERVGKKSEKYYIIGFNKKEKEKKISLPYETWKELKTDQTVKLKVSVFGDGELIE